MSQLRIRLLGGLALFWDDQPPPSIPSAAVRSLLAYLVVHRDRPHTRDLLAGTFWPDLPNAVARRRLSRALWQIRRVFQPHTILLTEGDTVRLHPDLPVWLDVEEFGRLVDLGIGRLVDLSEAVELYRGEFLAGYYNDWLLVERERLREMFLMVLAQLVEGYKRRGEYEQALTYARRLLGEDAWREEAHREVMRLCYLLGRSAEALKQYELCRAALAEELGVEPSPETTALAAGIAGRCGQGAVLDLPQIPLPPAAIVLDGAQALELPLVGREQERAELLAHVEALLQGLGGIVLVEGEAGVGKTRLLRTMAHDAEWRGAEVLWGAEQELKPSAPYGPLVEALTGGLSPLRAGQLARLVERIWLQVLAPVLPSLATGLPALSPAPQLDPSQERDRLAAALVRLLGGWGRIKPLLVVLENLHWMGEDMLDMLARLAPSLGERGVLIVGSYRGEDARALPEMWQKLEALDRAGVRQRLTLSRLGAAATGELIRRSLGMGTPAPLFEARLYQETKGNALFILETLRILYGEGLMIRDENGDWSTPWDETTSDYVELPLPRAVEQTIARRLAFLPPPLQRMVHLAAVLGERFEFDLLHAASREESPCLLAALRELVQLRFLDETTSDYRFNHDKIRRVAYDGIEVSVRSSLHGQVAHAMEALHPDRVTTLAHHWAQAGVWDKAADYHQQAGDGARAVYANAEAAAHYTQALEALERWPGVADPERIFELRLAREAAYDLLGKREAQAEDLQVLAAVAQEMGDEARQAEVALRQAHYATVTSDYPAAVIAAQAAVGLAEATQDVNSEAVAHLQWGRALWYQGSLAEARLHLEHALDLARVAQLCQVEADSLRNLGVLANSMQDHAEAKTYFEQSLDLYRAAGYRQGEAQALASLGMVSMTVGDYAQAEVYYQRALCIRREMGDQRGECNVLNDLGFIAIVQTDYARIRAYCEQLLRISREVNDRRGEGLALVNFGVVSTILGEYAEAKAYHEQALNIFREIGDRRNEGLALRFLSRLWYHLGDARAARQVGEQALHIAQGLGDRIGQAYTLKNLGHALTSLGCLSEAADAYRQALDVRREMGHTHLAVEALAGAAYVSMLQGDLSQALACVEEFLTYLERHTLDDIEEPFWMCLSCYRVLCAAQDVRAGDFLNRMHRLLQEKAARISDAALRRSFLENVPAHRELVAAYRQRFAAQMISIRLPRADAPLGRPLRDDEYVPVTWTVHAPEDEALHPKTARRRQRLLRLLAEAQAQGAAPTQAHLADALDVSRRTVERDVAALRRAQPDLPPTRRKMSE